MSFFPFIDFDLLGCHTLIQDNRSALSFVFTLRETPNHTLLNNPRLSELIQHDVDHFTRQLPYFTFGSSPPTCMFDEMIRYVEEQDPDTLVLPVNADFRGFYHVWSVCGYCNPASVMFICSKLNGIKKQSGILTKTGLIAILASWLSYETLNLLDISDEMSYAHRQVLDRERRLNDLTSNDHSSEDEDNDDDGDNQDYDFWPQNHDDDYDFYINPAVIAATFTNTVEMYDNNVESYPASEDSYVDDYDIFLATVIPEQEPDDDIPFGCVRAA